MQSKDADVSTDGSKRMKSASKRPPSSSSPGALHYMAPVFSRLEMLDCSVYSRYMRQKNILFVDVKTALCSCFLLQHRRS